MNKDKDSTLLLPEQDVQNTKLTMGRTNDEAVISSTQDHAIYHYWLNKQNGYPQIFKAIDKNDGSDIQYDQQTFLLNDSLSELLLQTAKHKDFNVYKLMLANLNFLLHQCTGRKDILLAQAPIQINQEITEKEAVLFSFLTLESDLSVRQLLKGIHQELEQNMSHQAYDYAKFQRQFPAGVHFQPALIDVAFAYDPVSPKNEAILSAQLLVELKKQANNDLALQLRYNADFEAKSIEQFAQQCLLSLNWLCGHLDAQLSDAQKSFEYPNLDLPFADEGIPSVFPRPRLAYYPLSPPQNRMFLLQHLAENSVTYNVPFYTPIDPSIGQEQLLSIFQQLIDRHESLRTSFELCGNEPVQVVHEKMDFEIPLLSAASFEGALQQFVQPFNLHKAPLIRVALWKSEEANWLLIDQHHIITDAFSQDVLGSEMVLLLQGKTLAPISLQYKDYVQWLAQPAQLQQLALEEQYWLNEFSNPVPLLDFPLDTNRISTRRFQGATASFFLSKEEMSILNDLTNKHGCTINTLLLAIWTVFLAKITGEEDIVVGTPVAGRTHPDLKQIVGMFVNTVPIRSFPKSDRPFAQFLAAINELVIKGFDHQNYPFERLVEQVWDGRIKSRNPIFDTMFGLLNSADVEATEGEEEVNEEIVFDHSHQVAKFDIDLSAGYQGSRLHFGWNYDKDLYESDTIRKFIGYFRQLIKEVGLQPNAKIGELQILSKEERTQILAFNPPLVDYPSEQTIVQQFEQQVQQEPQAIAMWYRGHSINYQELNTKANQLAHYLYQTYAVQANDRITLLLEPGEALLVSLWAVLKSGAAYVPIDPKFPASRIEFIQQDCESKVTIDEAFWKQYEEKTRDYSDANPDLKAGPDHLAYVIYTSGSTGRAKGVMISHRSLSARFFGEIDLLGLDQNLVTCWMTNYVFDASLLEIFLPFVVGGAVLIFDRDEIYDTAKVVERLIAAKVKLLQGTPASIRPMLEYLNTEQIQQLSLEKICLGGESLTPYVVALIREKLPQVQLNNHYGPTETTIDAIVAEKVTEFQRNIIGRPMVNMQAYIMDQQAQLVPIGIKGELCLSGDGLAQGYLNMPEETKAKFIPHPVLDAARLYKTGDWARWLSDGQIEFFGRIDDQVKIRGYRIELGEVENALLKISKVSNAVVMAKEDPSGHQRLVAYLLCPSNFDKAAIQTQLKKYLPSYMIPAVMIPMDAFPLTANGKIDKKALPEPDLTTLLTNEYLAPETELEQELVNIWQSLLKVERVGVTDNFFDLGGHSLTAVQVANKVQEQFEVNLPIAKFFEEPTIRGLTQFIEQSEKTVYTPIGKAPEMPHYPLSHSQKGMWLVHQVNEDVVAYNVPDIERIKGAIDAQAIEQAFYQIIERHEILRTVFREVDREPRQFVLAVEDLPPFFELVDLTNDPQAEAKAGELVQQFVNTSFDFVEGPLIKVKLIKAAEDDYIIAVNRNHIISDGWSTTVLFNELLERYHALTQKQVLQLEPLPIQYKDYAYWQIEQLRDENNPSQVFWLDNLSGELPRLMLPEDRPRPAKKTYRGDNFAFVIENEIIEPIERIAKAQNVSMFMMVLAAFNTLFYRYTGLTDIIVGGLVAGREREELAKQLGYYVNTVVYRTKISKEDRFVDLLQHVKKNVLEVYEHQYYPFNHLVQQLDLPNDSSRSPLFDYALTFNNMEDVDQETAQKVESIEGQSMDWSNDSSKYDISFGLERNPGGMIAGANFNVDIYKKESIERLFQHFKNLLKSIGENENQSISDLEILGAERQLVIEQFNQTAIEKNLPNSMSAYFEQQVLADPNQIAVQLGKQEWTYGQINEKANQLADWLISNYKIEKGAIIASMINRSEWQVISMLAILKAGGAYLPIDPAYPSQRIHSILSDAKPILTLVKNKMRWDEADEFAGIEIINLDAFRVFLSSYSPENPGLDIQPDDLAYVIYTSGSTGKPKGVMVEHRGNLNMASFQSRLFSVTKEDRCLQFASIAFDASIAETSIAFFTGSPVVLIPNGIIDNPVHFVNYLKEQQVTLATLPPVYLAKLEREGMLSLRVILTAGEAPNLEDALYYAQHLDYYNGFGPTEFSVCSSIYKVKGDEQVIPIGAPMDNAHYYILDEQLQPLPIGCWGEIYIAGDGIARGYLNRPELTAKTFIDNPFVEGTKMYKSGDLGKWLPSGEVVFSGRNDHMVKIRGYRVELGEIEQVLLLHPDIQQVIVNYQKRNNRDFLIAYLLTDTAAKTESVINLAKAHLPDYMIPGHYLFIDEIPLTPNGKTDFKALPFPEYDANRNLAIATTVMEAELVSIWKEILKMEEVGVEENFFEIGGNSLMAMMLTTKVWEQYRYSLTIGDLVNNPTIVELATLISKAEEKKGLLLPLNKYAEGRKNIFMIPPIMGTPIVFYGIAKLFEKANFNCYGLQYKGFDQKDEPDPSILAMAASYFAEMESMITDKSEPVIIIGYSMGGMIGFELVNLLEQNGYKCQFIILDKEAFSADKRKFKNVIEADELEVVKSLWEEYCQTTGLRFTNEEAAHMKRFLLHHWKLHNKFILNKKIKSNMLAVEANWADGMENLMKPWKKQTRGRFVYHKLSTDHNNILDEKHLPTIVNWVLDFIQQK